jgi:hypothetical protein
VVAGFQASITGRFWVSTEEQDENFTFSGLGNAVRKCRTDFGVEIVFRSPDILHRHDAKRLKRTHAAIAEIFYPGGERGWLLYLKSSLTGDEPGDVLEYAWRVKQFPHESTADQWFDESQFESYRKLGYHIADTVLRTAVDGMGKDVSDEDWWHRLFAQLQLQRSPSPPNRRPLQRRR